MKTILRAQHLSKTYGLGGLFRRAKINALDDVNLNVESDQPVVVSLVGESGSGKTTFAKVVLRLVEPSAGRVVVFDQPVAGKGVKPDKREFLSIVQPIFQNPFEAFSSYRNVDSYLMETAIQVNGLKQAEAVEVVADALASVGLKYEDVKGKYYNQFSGGELQRISVARALIPHPNVVIADEPVSMIDASLRMNVINLFLSLKEEFRISFLYITHDLATAYYVSDHVAVLYRGNVVEFGPARLVLTDPRHPYTRLLLDSIPLTNRKWESKQIVLADIETKEYQLEGCKFRNRCPYAREICGRQRPPLVKLEDGREVYCHMVAGHF
ncbi:MAG TPA: ABC transporter ATP-binding protein [Chloroflexi bacterium]|nr:ABC transporter ATP-binding protein [Chloroflexota bacterium]